MERQIIETRATQLTYEDGLLTIRSKGVHSTRDSVEETLAAAGSIVNDTRGPMLFDAREWPGGDPEGWISVITNIGRLFNAIAMLVDPNRLQEVGPFPKAIDRLVIPFRTFDDEASALAFLEPFRHNAEPSA